MEEVKNVVGLTEEWRRLRETVSACVNKALEENRITEQTDLLNEITRSVSSKVVYHDLQAKVAEIIEECSPRSEKTSQDQALNTVILLLHQRPLLRKHLKVFINVTFPLPLRQSAWRAFLQNELIRKDCLALHSGKTKKEFKIVDQELFKRCTSILQSDRLPELKKGPNLSFEFYFVLNLWKQKTRTDDLTSNDFLICLPFLYLFKDELISPSSEIINWPAVATVTEMFFAFMHIRPLSMRNVLYEAKNREAVLTLCETIETTLTEVDLELVQQLRKILSIRNKKEHRDTNPFSYQLGNLIHPFLQRIFVGVLSLEVVSFVIDQCFIVLDIPHCSFMPYFIVIWFSLLRKKIIIGCRNAENVKEILEKHSNTLTVLDFQLEIKKKLLTKILDQMKLPHMHDDHLLFDLQVENSLDDKKHDNRKRELSKQTILLHSEELEKKHKIDDTASKEHDSRMIMSESSKQTILLREEEKKHKIDDTAIKLGIASKEHANIKQVLAEKDETIAELRHQIAQLNIDKQASIKDTSTVVHQNIPPELPDTLPKLPPTNSSSNNITHKKYDPSNLSEEDIKEIWLKIMRNFNSARYLICHGTGIEKQQLMKSVSEYL